MPQFSYQARNSSQELIQGIMDSNSSSECSQLLRQNGLIPLKITAITPSSPKDSSPNNNLNPDTSAFFNFFSQNRVDPLDVLLFSQQMSRLLKSGVPILRALAGIQESAPNPSFAKVIQTIRSDLDSGRPLSTSLAKHPQFFNSYYINMIRVGELSGKLEEVFLKLHEQMEFARLMNNQIKSATRYPLIVVGVMFAALAVINLFVIPAFAKIYSGFKAELPLFTQILIASSNGFIKYWWLGFMIVIISTYFTRKWLKTKPGRLTWDRWKLQIPIAGQIIHKATMARFCKSLSLALEAGVPIASALSLVSETSENAFMIEKLAGLKIQIEHGDSLHKSAVQSQVFTPIALQMILVGEESGSLEAMLKDVSDLYQSQVEYELKTLGSQIEPILILFLGALVLILALGVFLPIWDLGSAAMKK